MAKLTANIVGMHFRPPAKDVVNMLPPGTPLLIQREPTNEYDEFAVKVILPGFEEPKPGDTPTKVQEIRQLLKDGGGSSEELYSPEAGLLHIAYIDSKKTGLAKMFSQDMLSEQNEYEHNGELLFDAELCFDLAGKPQVATDLVVSTQQYEDDRAEPIAEGEGEDSDWGDC